MVILFTRIVRGSGKGRRRIPLRCLHGFERNRPNATSQTVQNVPVQSIPKRRKYKYGELIKVALIVFFLDARIFSEQGSIAKRRKPVSDMSRRVRHASFIAVSAYFLRGVR